MNELFEYPLPHVWELREMYPTPYRFSPEVQKSADLLFKHPRANKWNQLYGENNVPSTPNDMCKVAYLGIKYALDNPNQFGGAIENCMDGVLVMMWKNFLGLGKLLRGNKYARNHRTSVTRMLSLAQGGFLELMMKEIKDNKMIMSSDDMVKKRKDLGLRERKLGYSHKQMEHLCNLD